MQIEMKQKSKKPKISLIDFFLKTKVKFDTVIIDEIHEGNEHTSLIGRAQALALSLGTKKIALSGNTGKTTGPHLHFEIRRSTRTVDPALVLNF